MKRWILVLIGAALWPSALPAAEPQVKSVEIGYIESFDHRPDAYVLKTGDARREVAILAPVFNGDTIEVKDAYATLTLRLAGQDGPTVLSKANQVATITGEIPRKGFLSGVFGWTASVVQLFDREQREQVSASIRDLGSQTGSQLSAPLLARPQTLLAGRRKLTIGWVSPLIVEVRILDGDGRQVANGQGSRTPWTTPEVDWKPGEYTIELAALGETIRQSLHFLPPHDGPTLPAELADPTAVPESLRAVAIGAWYAAEDPAFLLEALQHVAPAAGSSRPARLLAQAFTEGKRPPPPTR
jgi:hypothetical protein